MLDIDDLRHKRQVKDTKIELLTVKNAPVCRCMTENSLFKQVWQNSVVKKGVAVLHVGWLATGVLSAILSCWL